MAAIKNELKAKNELWKLFEAQLPKGVEEIKIENTDITDGIIQFKVKINGKPLRKKYECQINLNEV